MGVAKQNVKPIAETNNLTNVKDEIKQDQSDGIDDVFDHNSKEIGIEPIFRCIVSGCKNETSFKSEKSLGTHIKNKHYEEKIFTCSVCEQRFPTKIYLLEHKRRTHFNPRRFQCDQCEHVSKTMTMLNLHLTKHKK